MVSRTFVGLSDPKPFYLSYHEPALVIEWRGHTCSFLLDTKPLWHWGKRKSWPTSKETFDQGIDPLASVHYTVLKPLVNSYIQQWVQTKWDVAVRGTDLYLVKPTLGPPKKYQHLTRAEEVVITRLRIAIQSPPSPISCPEDSRLLVTIVVKHWPLAICSWGVQTNVETNTTQLTHWILSSRQFPRLA